MSDQYKYFAFISYKKEDEFWAKWLQRKLEYYKLPTEIRKKYPNLDFSESPRHVFKDTTDLSGGILENVLKVGLDSSKFLIVICSPRAAQSKWVCKEVENFIDSGRAEFIIPFIIEGEPNSNESEKECFPAALKSLRGDRELLGININENGREAAAVKVVARMFDISFDSLWQRFRRKKRRKLIKIWFALFFVIVSLLSLSLYVQFKNEQLIKSNELVKQNRSRYVLKEAMGLIEDGDIYTAQRLCLDLINYGDTDSIIKPEIEKVLYAAEDSSNIPYKQIAIFKEHASSVKKCVFSPNGEYIASRDKDSKVIIQKTNSGKIVCIIDSIYSELDDNSIDFSPNGKEILLSGSTLSSYDIRTGKQIKVIEKWGKNAKYNKRGDKIFYIHSGDAYIYDLIKNRKKRIFTKGEDEQCIMGVFNTKENNLAIIIKKGEGKYYLCEVDEYGKKIRKVLASERYVSGMAYSPNGQNVAIASTDGTAKVWCMETGKLLSIFNKTNDYVTSVKFDKGGKIAISTGFKHVYIWNPNDGTLIAELKGHNRLTNDVDISHDGRYLVSCSSDNTVRLWTLKSDSKKSCDRKIISKCGHIVEWVPNKDTTMVLYGDGYSYSVYNFINKRVQHFSFNGVGSSPIFTDNEKCFVRICADGYIRKWHIKTGNLVDSVKIKDKKVASDFVWWYRCANINKEYAYVAGQTQSYKFNLYDNTLKPFYDKSILYYDVVNLKAAVVTSDYYVSIVSLNKDSLFTLNQDSYSLKDMDFSKEKNLIATSKGYSVIIWKADDGEKLFENTESKTSVYHCKFSNDSKYLVSGGGSFESEMRIWDTNSWTCIMKKCFKKPTGPYLWISKDKSILTTIGDSIYRLDLPCYYRIVNNLKIRFKNIPLSDSERDLYFINREK